MGLIVVAKISWGIGAVKGAEGGSQRCQPAEVYASYDGEDNASGEEHSLDDPVHGSCKIISPSVGSNTRSLNGPKRCVFETFCGGGKVVREIIGLKVFSRSSSTGALLLFCG
jgi:hypothetical protein